LRTSFDGRYKYQGIEDPDAAFIEEVFLHEHPMGGEWSEATIKFESAGEVRTMIVLSDKRHGFYLKFIDHGDEPWLSLGDQKLLGHNITPDDWEAAAGLFVDRIQAFSAVSTFLKTGKRSANIEWIRPDALPEHANH